MADILLRILIFTFLSGLLAMLDAAMLSVNRAEVEVLVKQKRAGALALKNLVLHLPQVLVVLVIITSIINILGPILVGERAVDLYGHPAIGVVTAILTFVTIIFAEIIPKSLGSHYAPTIARIAAPGIVVLIYILFPLVWLLEKVVDFFKTGTRHIGTEDQIRALVGIGRRAGYIEEDERQLIQRAFVLNDRTAKDVMVPRQRIVGIPASATMREAAKIVMAHTYSRYPLYEESLDHITGLVLSRDILGALAADKDEAKVQTIQRAILRVPQGRPCDDLLILFRSKHIHLAVVEQDKKTIGVVTLEDVLEELVGEIEDEVDEQK